MTHTTEKPLSVEREYRVTWQREIGHLQQTRLYQRPTLARKFFGELKPMYKRRIESRVVGKWEREQQ